LREIESFERILGHGFHHWPRNTVRVREEGFLFLFLLQAKTRTERKKRALLDLLLPRDNKEKREF
jgi:hypothetical protein